MRCQNQTSEAIQKVEADLSSSFYSDLSCNSSKNWLDQGFLAKNEAKGKNPYLKLVKIGKKYDFTARPK